eukprot:COSAG01_NODE_15118_length_1372_cov_2.608013_2_plen_138_part_00
MDAQAAEAERRQLEEDSAAAQRAAAAELREQLTSARAAAVRQSKRAQSIHERVGAVALLSQRTNGQNRPLGGAGLISRWRADMGAALQVAGFNGLCGPFDGDQCPSCQRYQEQVLRESRPQAWREVREAFPFLCGPV